MNDSDQELSPADLPSHVRLRIAYYAACVAVTAVAVPFYVAEPFLWRTGMTTGGVALTETATLTSGYLMTRELLSVRTTVRAYLRALRQDKG